MTNKELDYKENIHLFRIFCSLMCLIKNKKFNTANILLFYLQNEKVRILFKDLLSLNTDYEAIKVFLDFDPALYKSKYIMKYLNNVKGKSVFK